MNANELLDEIRGTRDALLRQCGGDMSRLGDRCRAGESRWVDAGHAVVSFEGQPPMKLPLPDWDEIDAQPESEIIAEIRATRRKLAHAESCILREEPPA